MKKGRLAAAVLLALPLIVFGSNWFLKFIDIPDQGEGAGVELLQLMRSGGLMTPIAASHVLVGVMLLLPATRFAGGLLQLPISLGIAAFHLTMLPEGNGVAIFMLVLNLLIVADAAKVRTVLGSGASS